MISEKDFLELLKKEDLGLHGSVQHITSDTRKIKKNTVFFLLSRANSKFEAYYEQALKAQALLVVHSHPSYANQGVYVEDVEQVFSEALQVFYRESFENLKIYGLTGTNGKTTTSFMLRSMLEAYGFPTGVFGTVGNFFGDSELKTDLTSPVAEDFYRFNAENYKKGMRAAVCEVSSHALDQKRLGLKFLSGAGFTSFSQDHLDYHKTMEAYLEAKKKITSEALKNEGFFCISQDLNDQLKLVSPEDRFARIWTKESLKYKNLGLGGFDFEFAIPNKDKKFKGHFPMIGLYNLENFCLALTMLTQHFDSDFFPDQRVLTSLAKVPGRMERMDLHEGSFAFVDFSHTPDSLQKALETLRPHTKKLICVFGCGGDRDKKKRPEMARVSSQIADHLVLTSDNPRSEDPKAILKDMEAGLTKGSCYDIFEDRAEAIAKALELSKAEPSVVLIAGKGHEATQEVNGVKKAFSDKEAVLSWCRDDH